MNYFLIAAKKEFVGLRYLRYICVISAIFKKNNITIM
jgi:hypothetical protein